jgi:pantoate--beta-alanine ligase
MHIVRTVADLRSELSSARVQQRSIGFVPTMGALHRGHAQLIRRSVSECDITVASIFVNPLQFNNSADLDTYPKTMETDLELCARLGVEIVFAPDAQEMYPDGFETHVHPGSLATRYEGASRPGHFEGMCTVVAKLLLMVQPTYAFFGKKDYQQLAIVKRMAIDFNLETSIVGCETIRDEDGLALSSRNVRLDATSRREATVLPRALSRVRELLRAGSTVDAARNEGLSLLSSQPGLVVDYLEIVDKETLSAPLGLPPLDSLVVLGAVTVAGVHLIDNLEIEDHIE